jgi:hypothetical protein
MQLPKLTRLATALRAMSHRCMFIPAVVTLIDRIVANVGCRMPLPESEFQGGSQLNAQGMRILIASSHNTLARAVLGPLTACGCEVVLADSAGAANRQRAAYCALTSDHRSFVARNERHRNCDACFGYYPPLHSAHCVWAGRQTGSAARRSAFIHATHRLSGGPLLWLELDRRVSNGSHPVTVREMDFDQSHCRAA